MPHHSHASSPRLRRTAAAVLLGLGLAQLTLAQTPSPAPVTTPAPASAGSNNPAGNSRTAPPPGAPAAPNAPRPFAEVIKDAKAQDGHFRLFRKDEKVWLEIAPGQLNQPFFFSVNIPRAVGERGLYGSQMGRSYLVEWRQVGQLIQLVALNTRFHAQAGTPQARFVSESFAESLLASAPVVSQKHPESQAVLIEANALLFTDLPGYQTRLEQAYRLPFALDTRHSSIAATHNTALNTGIEVRAHFAVPKLPAPPLQPPPAPMPTPPAATPDPRSLFTHFYFNLRKLPEHAMASRAADERVGYFTVVRSDYTSDTSVKTNQHWIKRWRLEKQDRSASVSAPRQPIVFWLDRNIPDKYRESVRQGILAWNQAFERIGFRNAIEVRQQTEQDDFNTLDAQHASVRWFTGADVGFAIGPSHADPRTGEILDADMGMSDVFARGARRLVAEDLFGSATSGPVAHAAHEGHEHCQYAAQKEHELHFAMDWLESRGLAMDSPQAEALAQAYVKDVMMHETGHVLGLRHNFKGSTAYSLAQLEDPSFTREKGLSSSVMDYLPFNLQTEGKAQAEWVMSTLGPYDYWAIEYGYREFKPEEEGPGLARIASRSREPELAFATDEDAGYGPIAGVDPQINRFDLGSDPMAYYEKRMALSRQLWQRLEHLSLAEGESYERLTRSFLSAFRQVNNVAPLAAKYIGGIYTRRDRAGDRKPLYEPVPAGRQLQALQQISRDFLQAGSFRFSPELLGRLALDPLESERSRMTSVSAMVLNLHKSLLDPLMSAETAQRLTESALVSTPDKQALTLARLVRQLQEDIWQEVRSGKTPDLLRRNLQREHLRRSLDMVVKPAANVPADARSLYRLQLEGLAGQLHKRLQTSGLAQETRAHYSESLASIRAALTAGMHRNG